jgi:hypothetical protein
MQEVWNFHQQYSVNLSSYIVTEPEQHTAPVLPFSYTGTVTVRDRDCTVEWYIRNKVSIILQKMSWLFISKSGLYES